MQTGRGGMGSHKHGVSGRVTHNKTNAMARAREVNRELESKGRRNKMKKNRMVNSVLELFREGDKSK